MVVEPFFVFAHERVQGLCQTMLPLKRAILRLITARPRLQRHGLTKFYDLPDEFTTALSQCRHVPGLFSAA